VSCKRDCDRSLFAVDFDKTCNFIGTSFLLLPSGHPCPRRTDCGTRTNTNSIDVTEENSPIGYLRCSLGLATKPPHGQSKHHQTPRGAPSGVHTTRFPSKTSVSNDLSKTSVHMPAIRRIFQSQTVSNYFCSPLLLTFMIVSFSSYLMLPSRTLRASGLPAQRQRSRQDLRETISCLAD
jgi:hypothetical protein